MKRVQLEPGYLLHHRAYRETSALIEVFSRAHGRVALVARGVRSGRGRTRPVLQPFQPMLLSWSERGDLGTLGAIEHAGPAVALGGDAIFSGWYLNELLLRMLTRHDPHPELYALYEATLTELCGEQGSATLRLFELRLLEQLGYGLHFPDDLEPDGFYEREPDGGFHPCEEHGSAFRGASLIELAGGKPRSATALRDARRLLREALVPHLGGRPLRTPEMLRSLRAVSRAPESAHG